MAIFCTRAGLAGLIVANHKSVNLLSFTDNTNTVIVMEYDPRDNLMYSSVESRKKTGTQYKLNPSLVKNLAPGGK